MPYSHLDVSPLLHMSPTRACHMFVAGLQRSLQSSENDVGLILEGLPLSLSQKSRAAEQGTLKCLLALIQCLLQGGMGVGRLCLLLIDPNLDANSVTSLPGFSVHLKRLTNEETSHVWRYLTRGTLDVHRP